MSKAPRYICIHGHFYQPPRENAWLDSIEIQDSAAPFHDWNERINFECYATNAEARILDSDQHIIRIRNNYKRISFNMGPTLLSWMETADPETYAAILDADARSQELFSGHGAAIAQAHSHLIMPLCNERDKETQVKWGIADFEKRFNRKPEGMWLAETAVDTASLEVLAAHGIKYTILAPRQVKAIRSLGGGDWKAVDESSIDTRRAYQVNLPSGKSIAIFVYNGDIAQEVAFKGILNNGKNFAERLTHFFSDSNEPQLVNVATDGESYGHHHRHGEMALASCLEQFIDREDVQLTNYGEFLAKFPPQWELEIHDNSSWSCVHGVERWRSDCGCNTGGEGHWNQSWRAPLRDTLDWLRQELIRIYESEAPKLLKDPWAARDAYIDVVLDRSSSNIAAFFEEHSHLKLNDKDRTKALRLLEMQRHAMFMYTSCGWFFSEVTGIETMQILQYANRAIHYAYQVAGEALHPEFLSRLEKVPSNTAKNAAEGYRKVVLPAAVDLERVGMHYATMSLFEAFPERLEFYNFIAESQFFDRLFAGEYRLVLGRTVVTSRVTLSRKHFSFVALYYGQQHIVGNINTDTPEVEFMAFYERITETFKHSNLTDTILMLQSSFGNHYFTIDSLFFEQKRALFDRISQANRVRAETSYRDIVHDNYQLMTAVKLTDAPLPAFFTSALRYVLNADLRHFFRADHLNRKELIRIAGEFEKWEMEIDNVPALKLLASERVFEEIKKIDTQSVRIEHVEALIETFKQLLEMGVDLNLWKAKNQYFAMLRGYRKGFWVFASPDWEAKFRKLGELLNIHMQH